MLHHHDLSLLSNTPDVKPHAFVVHLAAAMAHVVLTMDSFSAQKELDATLAKYRSLKLQGAADLRAGHLHERASASVGQILALFQK
jgi:hypothetical protein